MFDASWLDIGDPSSCSRPTTALRRRCRPAERATRTRPLAVAEVALSSQSASTDTSRGAATVTGVAPRSSLPARCVSCGAAAAVLCAACRAALRPVARAALRPLRRAHRWPVERCRECAGGGSPSRSARAAVRYAGPGPRARARRGRSAGSAALARSRPSSSPRCRSGRPRTSSRFPPDGDGSRSAATTRPRGSPRELARAGSSQRRAAPRAAGAVRARRGLALAERRANVRGAFAAVGAVPARSCLVDDVYTTGATVSAAASALARGRCRSRSTSSPSPAPSARLGRAARVRYRPPPKEAHAASGEGQERGGQPVDPRVRRAKLAKLDKQLADQTQVEVELAEQRNPSIAAATSPRRRSSPRGRRCARARPRPT